MDHPTASTPLGDVREYVRIRAADGGVDCPACTQHVKVYRRPLNSGMARSLITMWLAAGRGWQHVPTTVGGRSREEGKLRYWSLIEEATEQRRPDGGRAGYWRLTEDGEQFVRGLRWVPRYALVYDGRLLDHDGDLITIRDALGDRFDYDVLMHTPGGVSPVIPNDNTERN